MKYNVLGSFNGIDAYDADVKVTILNPAGTSVNVSPNVDTIEPVVPLFCINGMLPVINKEPVSFNEPVISAEPENGNCTPCIDDVNINCVLPFVPPTQT